MDDHPSCSDNPGPATGSAYDLEPTIDVCGRDADAFAGEKSVASALAAATQGERLLVVECYPGVSDEALELARRAFAPDVTIRSEDAFPAPAELEARMRPYLTDDRVRGVMCPLDMEDFLDPTALRALAERVRDALDRGLRVLVYGVGATLVAPDAGTLVYGDLARWEIQRRYRAGMPNFRADNADEDILRKVKRGYFVEWRLADRRKEALLGRIDWLLDTNEPDSPRLVSGPALRDALGQVARRPFRLVPYFDPGVWGGHWMQERFGLDPASPNFAWAFDGVPEENSLYLRFGDVRVEVPAMDLTLARPRELLGEPVLARFGAEFPIRFDFLDTMGGSNLSLQVHPTADYIRERFAMPYTQDESYYIMDAGPGAAVYLGIRDDADPREMMAALREADRGGAPSTPTASSTASTPIATTTSSSPRARPTAPPPTRSCSRSRPRPTTSPSRCGTGAAWASTDDPVPSTSTTPSATSNGTDAPHGAEKSLSTRSRTSPRVTVGARSAPASTSSSSSRPVASPRACPSSAMPRAASACSTWLTAPPPSSRAPPAPSRPSRCTTPRPSSCPRLPAATSCVPHARARRSPSSRRTSASPSSRHRSNR